MIAYPLVACQSDADPQAGTDRQWGIATHVRPFENKDTTSRLRLNFGSYAGKQSVAKVFISYRRESASGEARAMHIELTSHLGRKSVVMDVDSFSIGRDFRAELQKELESCDVVLVLIDPRWIEARNKAGGRRLDEPTDFVRQEVEVALQRDITVLPVLLGGASPPQADQLPAELKELAFRNAFEISHSRWKSDIVEMLGRLRLIRVANSSPSNSPWSFTWYQMGTGIIASFLTPLTLGFQDFILLDPFVLSGSTIVSGVLCRYWPGADADWWKIGLMAMLFNVAVLLMMAAGVFKFYVVCILEARSYSCWRGGVEWPVTVTLLFLGATALAILLDRFFKSRRQ